MAAIAPLYADRTTEILAGAKSAFAQKGFDGASMQDLARAAGMSAGNFYRYFPSKNAIVAAMIDVDLAGVKKDFEVIQTSADPVQALFDTMCHRIDNLDCDDGPLWAEIDAAARRRPEIGQVVGEMELEIGQFLVAIFSRISGLPLADAAREFSGHAAFLIMLFKGASQRLSGKGSQLPDQTRTELRALILKTIEQTLTDVAAARRPSEES